VQETGAIDRVVSGLDCRARTEPMHARDAPASEEASGDVARPIDAAGRGFPLEVLVVWLLFLADAVAMFVTYSRLSPKQLYHVSGSGIEGGASRVVVFANYSTALVAIPIVAIAADRLSRRVTTIAAGVAVVISAAVFWPGVVDQSDLDARPVNAIAANGVLLALALTAIALLRLPGRRFAQRQPGDRMRTAVAILAVLLGLPWIAADLGFYLNGVPGLRDVYQTGKLTWETPMLHHLFPTVHHGHHHGLDAVLLLLTALLLSRVVAGIRLQPLRIALGIYLAVIVAYAIANMANDAWDEQIVKRGWTDWLIPNVVQPKLSVAWAVIITGGVVLYAGARWWYSRAQV
jgi:hypothetical protein